MGIFEQLLEYMQESGLYLILTNPNYLDNLVMLIAGCVFIYLGVVRQFEPLLLVPIGFGIILGNMPFAEGKGAGVYDEGSVLWYLYFGVREGIYPPLIFLGIGAMTDFSSLIAQPKLMLLGAAAQFGIFLTFLLLIIVGSSFPFLGFLEDPNGVLEPADRLLCAAGSVGIIGGADGPTAIFLTTRLAPDLLGAIAVSAYSYMALVPVIQPPIMRLLTTEKERMIRMPPPPNATLQQRILFPIAGFLVATFIAPDALPLLGMLFLGNLLKESGVTERLARTARNPLIDIVTILLGLTVGASTQADTFLRPQSIVIALLGALAFAVGSATGVLFAKLMNLFLKEGDKINPLIGSAGVSAVPHAARTSQMVAHRTDPQNFVIMQAMAPNVAGVIGSAIAAGVLLQALEPICRG
ncbi:MAG: sodium ion-translocating decarboxylase subunit beta [Chloroflexaceae bacterium]|nr:sodium ion-translocating decarboxylase subunit beta [Chloroflexaceae bacterium]NJL34179.1 sodium ion-translocating decarboxylase subunit beta [Chloroflexaceae bacterium]NJO04991.1 sodium ion-translocating decarboxylase subunit beta [Chloroflexaceae bacterium]